MKEYSSFEEIDRDLKILKLQNQINKEEIRLSVQHTKESLSPISLIGGLIGSIAQKAFILKSVSKIFGLKKVIVSS